MLKTSISEILIKNLPPMHGFKLQFLDILGGDFLTRNYLLETVGSYINNATVIEIHVVAPPNPSISKDYNLTLARVLPTTKKVSLRFTSNFSNNEQTFSAGFLFIEPNIQASLIISSLDACNNLILFAKKSFLVSNLYLEIRLLLKEKGLSVIIDMENEYNKKHICIIIKKAKPSEIKIYSIRDKEAFLQTQKQMIIDGFWFIYSSPKFVEIYKKITFDCFTVTQESLVSKSLFNSKKISKSDISIITYDSHHKELPNKYLSRHLIKKMHTRSYLNADNVYIFCELNGSIYISKKEKNCLVESPLRLMTLKNGKELTEEQILFLQSQNFHYLYSICRNKSNSNSKEYTRFLGIQTALNQM